MDYSRRRFFKMTTGLSALAALVSERPRAQRRAEPPQTPPSKPVPEKPAQKMIGIQVGAISFLDEGVEPVLDIFQQKAAINTLFVATYTFGRGIAGRQVPGQPFPDHGVKEYDNLQGGNFATPHPPFYGKTIIKGIKAPDHGDFDVLAAVIPKAKPRGIRVYCWFEDTFRASVPNFQSLTEIDVYGRKTTTLCHNNPDYRNFLFSMAEDWCKSYEVDGVMWGSERQGPLNNAIGAYHGGLREEPLITCFCEFCRARARERGISIERARRGFIELHNLVKAARKSQRPNDGYFVSFWRILLNYPELLAWEKLWTDSSHDLESEMYGTIKSINNRLQVGWHVWHLNSFSPFYRAEQDYERLSQFSDFLKVVMYNNCGGPRLAEFLRNIHATILHDADPQDSLTLWYKIMNYEEAPFDKLATAGLSSDYVYRETKRAVEGVKGRTLIYPGIDIDIPTGANQKKTEPRDVRDAVKAAFGAGADGVILSRKYSEMKVSNLAAVGDALKEGRGKG